MGDFYVYQYLREDGTPYYIGKGTKRRAWNHGSKERIKMPSNKNNTTILKSGLSENTAHILEIMWIAFYGRIDNNTGILRNITDGGEGVSGLIFSEEYRKKLSNVGKGRKKSEEHKRKIGIANKGKNVSEETKRKISEKLKGISFSSERKSKMYKFSHGNKHKSKKCTIDGVRIFVSARELIKTLGHGKNGRRSPNFRYVT